MKPTSLTLVLAVALAASSPAFAKGVNDGAHRRVLPRARQGVRDYRARRPAVRRDFRKKSQPESHPLVPYVLAGTTVIGTKAAVAAAKQGAHVASSLGHAVIDTARGARRVAGAAGRVVRSSAMRGAAALGNAAARTVDTALRVRGRLGHYASDAAGKITAGGKAAGSAVHRAIKEVPVIGGLF